MKKAKTPGSERRQFPRFKSYDILQIIRGGHEPIVGNPKLVNVSEGGLCFYSNEPAKKGERIKLHLNIAEFKSSVTTFGRVAWNQASTEHPSAFFTGVEFVELKETDRDILRRLEKASRKKA